MKKLIAVSALAVAAFAQQGWYPHEGGLMKYRVNIRFGEEPDTMPDGWKFGRVSAVAVNAKGEVYVFHRGPKADPIVVFDGKGKFLRGFGKGMFGNPHGMRFDHQGNLWVTDNGDHQVMKFSPQDKLLLTLGIKGKAGTDAKTFNRPTDIAFTPKGDAVYISDGYGNSRVVKVTPEGKYLLDWGKKGKGPGEFNTPHSVAVDSKGTVYVSDRENNRIQIFDPNGKVPAAVDPPRRDPEPLHHAAGRDVDHHPPRQHREPDLRHAGRPHHAHRTRNRQDSRRDGKPRTLAPRGSQRRNLHRQPHRQRLPLVSRLAHRGSGRHRRAEARKLSRSKAFADIGNILKEVTFHRTKDTMEDCPSDAACQQISISI